MLSRKCETRNIDQVLRHWSRWSSTSITYMLSRKCETRNIDPVLRYWSRWSSTSITYMLSRKQGRIQDLKKEERRGEFLGINYLGQFSGFFKNLAQKRVGVRPPFGSAPGKCETRSIDPVFIQCWAWPIVYDAGSVGLRHRRWANNKLALVRSITDGG